MMRWKQYNINAIALFFIGVGVACEETKSAARVDFAGDKDSVDKTNTADSDDGTSPEVTLDLDDVMDVQAEASVDGKPIKDVATPTGLVVAPDGVGYCCPLSNNGCDQTYMGGWSPTETGLGYCGFWWDMKFSGLKPYIGKHGCPTMPQPLESCLTGADVASPYQDVYFAQDAPADISNTATATE